MVEQTAFIVAVMNAISIHSSEDNTKPSFIPEINTYERGPRNQLQATQVIHDANPKASK